MDGKKIMANIVNTRLAILGAMAVAGQRMPESGRDVVLGLSHKPSAPRKPNRAQRRALAAKLSHSGKAAGSKLARKALQGRL